MENKMRQISLLDTSVSTRNIGDEIIMDSVRREVADLVPEAIIRTVPTHERLGARSRGLLAESQVRLAGGTNLVGPPMAYSRLWKIGPTEFIRSPKATLMGCGWRRYDRRVTPYSAALLRRALQSEVPHAVRDQHTADELAAIGIENTIVTGCPTTWELTDAHNASIPQPKGDVAVIALNGKKDPAGFAKILLDTAVAQYERVYFWPQMLPDHRYLSQLPAGVTAVNPTLSAYDGVLSQNAEVDYIGSRLHAGIRALQHHRRTFIFELDNRATEMGNTLGLPTHEARADRDYLTHLITSKQELGIRIPLDRTEEWKNHVRQAVRAAA